MKTKWIVNFYILILSLGTLFSLYIPQTEVVADEPLVIPSEAIRLRILANSDMEKDQKIKRAVRDEVNAHITEWVSDLTSLEEARALIQSKLPEIQKISERVVKEAGSNQTVKTEFDKVDFPTKLYGQYLYPAGEYEAILITLGEGDGANWWCVLFPPLCFLDFSNGVAVSEGFSDEATQEGTVVEEEKVEEEVVTEQEQVQEEEQVQGQEQVQAQVQEEEQVQVQGQEQVQAQEQEEEQVQIQGQEQVQAQEQVQEEEQVQVQGQEQVQDEEQVQAQEQEQAQNQEQEQVQNQTQTQNPVYAGEKDEEEVEVKFFVVEIWGKLFR